MKLSEFIAANRQRILESWEADARRRVPRDRRDRIAPLRNHLDELLRAVVRDLESSPAEAPAQMGRADEREARSHVGVVGEKHGAGRAEEGVALKGMVSEFPVLRSCVTRLWLESKQTTTPEDLEDLARFNEAIDLALTKSVSEFMDRLNRSRETFLGILSHDLRSPLSTILMAAKVMIDQPLSEDESRGMARRIVTAADRMHRLVLDLLDFTRTRLGGRMPITRHEADLEKTVRSVADEFTMSHPKRVVRVNVVGDLHGDWDDVRIGQAVGNLIGNAMNHGASDAPIEVSARSDDKEVAISVHNEGKPIPQGWHRKIFEPLSNASRGDEPAVRKEGHLGLGLYIAKAIVTGHGGKIDVDSSVEHGTTFTLRLPRSSEHDAPEPTRADAPANPS